MHFIPVDHDEQNEKDREAIKAKTPPSLSDKFKSAIFKGFSRTKKVGGHEQDNHNEVRGK